ncbi:unnamed protein product [Rotaria magnacalcarata]|nr:unnamed protein product [Rotaria magnacalcarata]
MFNNDVQNATTNWETFHALLKGFGGTDSLNHHMFNSIGAWFYRYLVGVQLNGFNEDLIIRPRLTRLLTNVEAEVQTISGPILVSWELHDDDKTVTYDVTLPNSLYAIITFEPIESMAHCLSIEESGTLVWHRSSPLVETTLSGIIWIRSDSMVDNAMNIRIESGSYHWKVRWD